MFELLVKLLLHTRTKLQCSLKTQCMQVASFQNLESTDSQNAHESSAESAFASGASMCPADTNDQESVKNGKPVLKVRR